MTLNDQTFSGNFSPASGRLETVSVDKGIPYLVSELLGTEKQGTPSVSVTIAASTLADATQALHKKATTDAADFSMTLTLDLAAAKHATRKNASEAGDCAAARVANKVGSTFS